MKIFKNRINIAITLLVITLFLTQIFYIRGQGPLGSSTNPYPIGVPDSHTNNGDSSLSTIHYTIQLTSGNTYKIIIDSSGQFNIRLTTISGFQEGTTSGQTGNKRSIIYETFTSGTYKVEVITVGSTTQYTLSTAIVPSLLLPAYGAYKSDTTPHLDWTAVSSTSSYDVQVDDESNFFTPLRNGNPTVSFYDVSPALGINQYWWRVRTNGGEWSKVGSFNIFSGPTIPVLSHQ